MSSIPPRPSATIGTPVASASTPTMPKSSSPGKSSARAPPRSANFFASATRPANSISPRAARGPRDRLQSRAVGAFADDDQPPAQPGGRARSPDRSACTARGATARCSSRPTLARPERDRVDVHRRVQHGGVAPVGPPDALGHRPGDAHVPRDPLRGRNVPRRQLTRHAPKPRPQQAGHFRRYCGSRSWA